MYFNTDSGTEQDHQFGIRAGRVSDAFYPVYNRLFDDHSNFVADLESKLAEARMDQTVELYLSRALGLGVISGVVLWLLGLGLGFGLFGTGLIDVGPLIGIHLPRGPLLTFVRMARIPFLIFMSGLVFGTIGFAAVFGLYVVLPYSRASRRKREINLLLPDAVAFMYALSVGGMSQLEILEAMAKADDTYGEVALEFRTISQETEYFDTDYRSAIQKRATQTPSDELSQFFTDMLAIINSGGELNDFLEDKKELHFRTAKEEQERMLETLELCAEMYITLSLFPLLLIVILVIMSMMGRAQDFMLYGTVYGLIPLMGMGFLVLVSTLKQDELGDGYLHPDASAGRFEDGSGAGLLNLGLIQKFTGTYYIFDRIKNREGTYETLQLLKQPHIFFRDNPFYTLAVTVPVAVVTVAVAVVSNAVPVSWSGVVANPLSSTVSYVYIPLLVTCLPLAVFWEWNVRARRGILNNLSDTLRKLASANATGLTLLESVKMVAETSPGKLGEEFGTMYAKSTYGMHLKESLIVFNNKYHVPRLARTVKLISKAHETSSQISSVLATAAQATEAQDDIERERKSRSRMQVAIILMTYLTMLGVMAVLKTQFLGVMAEMTQQAGSGASSQSFGASIDLDQMSLLFFHAVTLQAIVAGLVSGYIHEAKLVAGVKYVVGLLLIALGVWVVIA